MKKTRPYKFSVPPDHDFMVYFDLDDGTVVWAQFNRFVDGSLGAFVQRPLRVELSGKSRKLGSAHCKGGRQEE